MNEVSTNQDWAGLLAKDEEILWQGRPAGTLSLSWSSPKEGIFALFFVGFSVFWMVQASVAGGIFWMFGLPFFGVGLYGLIGKHFWKAFVLKNTHYTLTNQSAFIATQVFGRRKLARHPITSTSNIELEEGDTSNIWFAEKTIRGENSAAVIRIGFEQIKDGRDAYSKFLLAQANAA